LNTTTSGRPVKYIATIDGVRDVSLVGPADYTYSADRLAGEELVPLNVSGRAEIWICADKLKWMGVSFAELSVSIRIGVEDIFLISAFNTSRTFSWFERTCFHTPYRHAQIDVDSQSPQSFALYDGKDVSIRAERANRAASGQRDEVWQGRIYLPSHGNARNKRRFFRARLSGASSISPFVSSSDILALHASPNHFVAQQLIDSHFRDVEWRVHTSATHARSKTFVDE
jgi:hypothetical protein